MNAHFSRRLRRLKPSQLGYVNVISRQAVREAVDYAINNDLIGEPIVVRTGGGRKVGKDAAGNNIWRRWPARKTLRTLTSARSMDIYMPLDYLTIGHNSPAQDSKQDLLAYKEIVKYIRETGDEDGVKLVDPVGRNPPHKRILLSLDALWWRMTHDYALVPCGGEMSHQAGDVHEEKR